MIKHYFDYNYNKMNVYLYMKFFILNLKKEWEKCLNYNRHLFKKIIIKLIISLTILSNDTNNNI